MIKISIQKIFIVFLLINIPFLFSQDDLEKARSLINDKKNIEAKTLLESMLETDPGNDQIYYYLGQIQLLAFNDPDIALYYLEKAVALKSDSSNYHYWLANGYGVKIGRSNVIKKAGLAKKIRTELEKAVSLNPKHIEARIQLTQYYLQTPGFMGGSSDKAYQQIQSILPLNIFRGKMLLAQYYRKEKKDSLAESEYLWLEKQYGDSAKYSIIHNIYGYYLIEQKRPKEAIDIFKKQIALVPDKVSPYINLGDSYQSAGQLEEAAEAYRKALEINPDFKPTKIRLQKVEKELQKSKNRIQ